MKRQQSLNDSMEANHKINRLGKVVASSTLGAFGGVVGLMFAEAASLTNPITAGPGLFLLATGGAGGLGYLYAQKSIQSARKIDRPNFAKISNFFK